MCDIRWNPIFHYIQAAIPHAGGLQRLIGRLIITIYVSHGVLRSLLDKPIIWTRKSSLLDFFVEMAYFRSYRSHFDISTTIYPHHMVAVGFEPMTLGF